MKAEEEIETTGVLYKPLRSGKTSKQVMAVLMVKFVGADGGPQLIVCMSLRLCPVCQ